MRNHVKPHFPSETLTKASAQLHVKYVNICDTSYVSIKALKPKPPETKNTSETSANQYLILRSYIISHTYTLSIQLVTPDHIPVFAHLQI